MSADPLTDKAAAEAFTKAHRHHPHRWNGQFDPRATLRDGRRQCCGSGKHEPWGTPRCANAGKIDLADGTIWCGIHSPEAVAKRKAKSDAKYAALRSKWDADSLAIRERQRREVAFPRLIDALRQIERGYNDPRALAREILADWPEERRTDDAA